MKPKISVLIIALFAFYSCTNQSHAPLTQEEKNAITSEIMTVSNQWIDDNKNMDADAAIRFWSTSPELRFAENGEFFANRDSIQSTLHNYYAQTTSMNVKWLDRDVRVLTKSIALMAGKFQFNIVFGDESNWQGTNAFTGVFIKENEKWSLIQGHESTQSE
jgi:hypothetical protein